MKTVYTYHKKNRSCDGLSAKKLTVTPDLGIGAMSLKNESYFDLVFLFFLSKELKKKIKSSEAPMHHLNTQI